MTDQFKEAEYVEQDNDVIVALHTAAHGSTEKAFMVSVNDDFSQPMWLSRNWCELVRPAKDGVRDLYKIPKHQAKHHKQLGGEKWGKVDKK